MVYKEFEHLGMTLVLSSYQRPTDSYPQPNFMGTGMALSGRLKKNQTLKQFLNKKHGKH